MVPMFPRMARVLYSFALLIQGLALISSSSLQSLPSSDAATPFLISFQTPSHTNLLLEQQNPKRYITADGKATDDCRFSFNFSIDAHDQLTGDNGEIYTTSEGIVSQLFVPDSLRGGISRSWKISFGVLQWHDNAFIGGVASFCIDGESSSTEVYFLKRSPLACRPITLHYTPLSACLRNDLSSIRSSSSLSSKTSSPSTYPSPTLASSQTDTALYTTVTTTSTGSDRLWPSTATTTGADRIETQLVTFPAYGLAYNAYINPFNIDNDLAWRDDFASMGPSYFNNNSNSLVTCGIAQDVRFYNDDVYTSINGYLPGQSILTDLEHIAVVFHGYFIAPETGTYTFSANSDDWGYVWLGSPTAETTWNESNSVASNRAGGPTVSGLLTVDEEGAVVPATFLYANAGQRCTCWFSIMFPNGTQVSDFTGLFVQPLVGTWGEWMPNVRNASTCPAPLAYTNSDDGGD